MPRIVDNGVEALVMSEIAKLHEKRRKLEDDIKAMDALSNRCIEMGALRDIDAYRTLHRASTLVT